MRSATLKKRVHASASASDLSPLVIFTLLLCAKHIQKYVEAGSHICVDFVGTYVDRHLQNKQQMWTKEEVGK
jgi:hypothetical protein